MSVKIKCRYLGGLRTELTHLPSGSKIKTDAPLDNGGNAETFSPTDLVTAALASCITTIMGHIADKYGHDLAGLEITASKEMGDSPRRISQIELKITFPPSLAQEDRAKYLSAVEACPVKKSLHPDIKIKLV
ncbi:MAG: OsmC family protein [Elusimicrobia bacterium]|nr:OsmC family protein [Elusimicrobiota bacterium]